MQAELWPAASIPISDFSFVLSLIICFIVFYGQCLFLLAERLLVLLHLGSHLGIVLLEALAQALLGEHLLLDAAGDAAGLAGGKGLGGEVVDAGGEAVVDEVTEQL